MSQTTLQPEVVETGTSARWMVVIFNNDTNSFDEVIDVLIDSTRCCVDEAVIEAWEAHTYGKAPVHFASKEQCEEIAGAIASIGLKTEVRPEWND